MMSALFSGRLPVRNTTLMVRLISFAGIWFKPPFFTISPVLHIERQYDGPEKLPGTLQDALAIFPDLRSTAVECDTERLFEAPGVKISCEPGGDTMLVNYTKLSGL